MQPVNVDASRAFSWYAVHCRFHDTALLNWRMAQRVPANGATLGGIIFAGQNGATATYKMAPSLLFTRHRRIEDCIIENAWGEGINAFSAEDIDIINCIVRDTTSGRIYTHNCRRVATIGNLVYVSDAPKGWEFERNAVVPKSDLVYPGFPHSRFSWVSDPPAGAYEISNPQLTGVDPARHSGIIVGTEYANASPGEDNAIINNLLYRNRIAEQFIGRDDVFGVPWNDASKSQARLKIAHNTLVASTRAPIELHALLLHPGAEVRNNVFDQDAAYQSPAWNTAEVAQSGNVYRRSPGSKYLAGTKNIVADPKLAKTGPISREWFTPQVGSGAIGAGTAAAGVLHDIAGMERGPTPTAGAIEYPWLFVTGAPGVAGGGRPGTWVLKPLPLRYWVASPIVYPAARGISLATPSVAAMDVSPGGVPAGARPARPVAEIIAVWRTVTAGVATTARGMALAISQAPAAYLAPAAPARCGANRYGVLLSEDELPWFRPASAAAGYGARDRRLTAGLTGAPAPAYVYRAGRMPTRRRYVQGAGEITDYGIDWGALLDASDTIAQSVWTTDIGDLVGTGVQGPLTWARIAYVAPRYVGRVVNTVTISDGRRLVRSLEIEGLGDG
jgi:hypothetical protein